MIDFDLNRNSNEDINLTASMLVSSIVLPC